MRIRYLYEIGFYFDRGNEDNWHKFWKFHAKTGVLQQNFQWKYDTKSPKLHLLILKGQIGKSIPVVEQVSQIMDNFTFGRNISIWPFRKL